MSNESPDKLVQFKEVAEHFDVSVQTVRTWVRDKKIPFMKLGNVYRFRLSDIEESLLIGSKSQNSDEVEEDDDEDEITESQIESGIAAVNSIGMLFYRRPDCRKQIREIIEKRPFNQKVIIHLYTGIPLKLSIDEIARAFQLSITDLREIFAYQTILKHPRYFTEDLHNALMEEFKKIDNKND